MKKIALLGGSFDPIHLAHIEIAKSAYQQFDLDTVRFIPSKNHAFKGELNRISDSQRIRLIELAISEHKEFELDLTEINSGKINYTIEYVEQLDLNTRYYFIIGQDNLLNLDKWHRIEDLFSKLDFICFNRPESGFIKSDFIKSHLDQIHFLDTVDLNISSSQIRENIRAKKDVKDFLPESVHGYILKHHLYQN